MLANRCRQLIERLLLEDEARLLGVWLDPIDVNDPNADRAGRPDRGEEADD